MKNLPLTEKQCLTHSYDINEHEFQSQNILSLINGQLIPCIQHFNFSVDQGYALVQIK